MKHGGTKMIKVIKLKKGVPTVIEYEGKRYVLDMSTKPKISGKKVSSITFDEVNK